jgi:hypothetical protein
MRQVTGARAMRVPTFNWQSGCEPVELAGGIVVHLAEAERFEPARGSWAHVSGAIPAIHDHGTRWVKERTRITFDLTQRDAYRSRQVLVLELVARKNLDKLRAGVDERE